MGAKKCVRVEKWRFSPQRHTVLSKPNKDYQARRFNKEEPFFSGQKESTYSNPIIFLEVEHVPKVGLKLVQDQLWLVRPQDLGQLTANSVKYRNHDGKVFTYPEARELVEESRLSRDMVTMYYLIKPRVRHFEQALDIAENKYKMDRDYARVALQQLISEKLVVRKDTKNRFGVNI